VCAPRQTGACTRNSCARFVGGTASPKRVARKGHFMLWPEDVLTYRALTKYFSGKCMRNKVDLHDSVIQISRYKIIFIFCYFTTLCSQPRQPPYSTGAPWQQIATSPLYSSFYYSVMHALFGQRLPTTICEIRLLVAKARFPVFLSEGQLRSPPTCEMRSKFFLLVVR
jgi:hypothetical protein